MRRALAVVTGRYLHEGLANMDSPMRAGESICRALGDPDLGGFDITTLVNGDCSAVRNSVYDFFASAARDDFLFGFFSGHARRAANGRLYLATTDTEEHRLPPTTLAADYLVEQIDDCRARQVVVLLDCSYAGSFSAEPRWRRGDRILILSAGSTEFAHESPSYADLFFQGIENGEADRDKNGLISVREAFDYAADQLRSIGVPQTPQMRAGTTGDLVLCPAPSRPTISPAHQRRIFVSYVREDTEAVDRLVHALRRSGFDVWLDRTHLLPGMRWQSEIREAIQAGDYFIACFSPRYCGKPVSYMNEELILAAEQLRLMPRSRRWFIPVMLEKCEIPDLPIGPGETLDKVIQYADFSQDWDSAFQSVIRSLNLEQSR